MKKFFLMLSTIFFVIHCNQNTYLSDENLNELGPVTIEDQDILNVLDKLELNISEFKNDPAAFSCDRLFANQILVPGLEGLSNSTWLITYYHHFAYLAQQKRLRPFSETQLIEFGKLVDACSQNQAKSCRESMQQTAISKAP